MLARLNTPRVIDHSPRPPDPEQLRRRAEAADAFPPVAPRVPNVRTLPGYAERRR